MKYSSFNLTSVQKTKSSFIATFESSLNTKGFCCFVTSHVLLLTSVVRFHESVRRIESRVVLNYFFYVPPADCMFSSPVLIAGLRSSSFCTEDACSSRSCKDQDVLSFSCCHYNRLFHCLRPYQGPSSYKMFDRSKNTSTIAIE